MIRLFVDKPIHANSLLCLEEKQAHYIFNVMKIKVNEEIFVFNNKDGEFLCKINSVGKKSCEIGVLKKTKDFYACPDIWLLFAPLKKDNTDFVIQKATELGVRKILPVATRYTIADKVRLDRLCAQAIEASEQCGRLDLPEIEDITDLGKLLSKWDKSRTLFFMDESSLGGRVMDVFGDKTLKGSPYAILVGPEGGFCEEEFKLLRSLSFVRPISLGKRILRAETAAITALSCFQAMLGDF